MLWAGLSVEGVSLVSGVEVHDHSPTEFSQPSVLIEDKWQDVSGRDTSCLVPRGPWLRAMELIGPKCTLLPGPGFVKEDHTSCYCRLGEFPPRSPLQFGVSGPLFPILIPMTSIYAPRAFLPLPTQEKQPVSASRIRLSVTQAESEVGGAPLPSPSFANVHVGRHRRVPDLSAASLRGAFPPAAPDPSQKELCAFHKRRISRAAHAHATQKTVTSVMFP